MLRRPAADMTFETFARMLRSQHGPMASHFEAPVSGPPVHNAPAVEKK
jgi:hypothetical protein